MTALTMRTLGFRTHVLTVVAAAVVVLASLGRAWYAPAPRASSGDPDRFQVHGPLHSALDAAQRSVTDPHGITGWDALGAWGTALAALAVVAALAAAATLVPGVQGLVREPLKYVALAMLAIAAWRVVDSPGANDALELRSGALIALIASLTLFVTAQAVAAAPLRRRVAPPRYTPPPPPVYEPGV
jgi:hypothetical protein